MTGLIVLDLVCPSSRPTAANRLIVNHISGPLLIALIAGVPIIGSAAVGNFNPVNLGLCIVTFCAWNIAVLVGVSFSFYTQESAPRSMITVYGQSPTVFILCSMCWTFRIALIGCFSVSAQNITYPINASANHAYPPRCTSPFSRKWTSGIQTERRHFWQCGACVPRNDAYPRCRMTQACIPARNAPWPDAIRQRQIALMSLAPA